MIDQITFLLTKYPLLQDIVAVFIICRVVFKSLFSILGKYVELTVDEKDNNKLHDIMATKKYKMFAFIVDLLASVKLPKLKGK